MHGHYVGDGLIGIKLGNDFLSRCGSTLRTGARSCAYGQLLAKVRDYRAAWIDCRLLEIGSVDERRSRLSQPKMLHVADDADNFSRALFVHWIWIIPEKELSPDGIFMGEKAMREGFVNDHDPWGRLRVVVVQEAALFQRNLERSKETGAHLIVPCLGSLVGRRSGMSQNRERISLGKMRRKSSDRPNGFHSGQYSSFLQELFIESSDLRRGPFHVSAGHSLHVLARFRQLDTHGQEIRCIESGMRFLQAQNRVDHEARADEKHHRQGDLGNCERMTGKPPRTSRSPARAFA